MVDTTRVAPEPTVNLAVICSVFQDISPAQLHTLLEQVLKGLQYEGVINIDAKIDPNFFKSEFIPGREEFFLVDPTTEHFPRRTRANQWYLSREHVVQLCQSIVQLLDTREDEREKLQILEKENEDYRVLIKLIRERRVQPTVYQTVKETVRELLEIIDKLYGPTTTSTEEKKIELAKTLPAWLEKDKTPEQENEENEALHNWTVVRDAVFGNQSIEGFDKAVQKFLNRRPVEGKLPPFEGVILKSDDPPLSCAPLRTFLNTWTQLLYSQNSKTKRQIELPSNRQIFVVPITNSDDPTSFDTQPIQFLAEVFVAIDHYIKNKPKPRNFAVSAEDGGEGGDANITQKETPEEVFKKLEDSEKLLRDQASLLTAVVLPQLFMSYTGSDGWVPIDQLKLNAANFGLAPVFGQLEGEFQFQLRRMLSEYSPEQIEALGTITGRTNAMRELSARLLKGKFRVLIDLYNKSWVENKIKRDNITDPTEAKRIQDEYYAKIDVQGAQIDRSIIEFLRKEEIAAVFQKASTDLARISALNTANASDFYVLLTSLGFPKDQQAALLAGLEKYAASTVKNKGLKLAAIDLSNIQNLEAVIGFALPQEWLSSLSPEQRATTYKHFILLCKKYLEIYQHKLADLYQSDDDLESPTDDVALSDEDFNEINRTRRIADTYRHEGAQITYAANRKTRESLDEDDDDNPFLNDILDQSEQMRIERINSMAQYFNALSPEQKVAFLANLGLYNEGMSTGNIDQAITQLIQDRSLSLSQVESIRAGVGWDQTMGAKTSQLPQELPYSGRADEVVAPTNPNLKERSSLQKQAADAAALGRKGLELLGRAATSYIPGAQFLPKEAQEAVGAGVLGSIGLAIAAILNSSGAALGAIVGAGAGFLIGGAPGMVVGATLGSFGGFIVDKLGLVPSLQSSLGNLASNLSSGNAARVAQFVASNVGTAGVSVGIAYGSLALASGMHSTMVGAFLPPLFVNQSESKYVTLTKTASPDGKVATPQAINYEVTIRADKGYVVTITGLEDKVTVKTDDKNKENPQATSPIQFDKVKSDPKYAKYIKGGNIVLDPNIADTQAIIFDYTQNYGKEFHDSLVTNVFDIKFNAVKGTETQSGQDAKVSKEICFGQCPQVKACFEAQPATPNVNACGVTADSETWSDSDWTLIQEAFTRRAGQNSTYVDLLCKAGPIKLYRVPGKTFGGCAPSADGGNTIVIYDLGMGTLDNAEYTLVHETGHAIDYRNSGLKEEFKKIWTPGTYYTYPYEGNESEAFAEGIADTVVWSTHLFCNQYQVDSSGAFVLNSSGKKICANTGIYQFPTLFPNDHNWFVQNIFGGNDPTQLQGN